MCDQIGKVIFTMCNLSFYKTGTFKHLSLFETSEYYVKMDVEFKWILWQERNCHSLLTQNSFFGQFVYSVEGERMGELFSYIGYVEAALPWAICTIESFFIIRFKI